LSLSSPRPVVTGYSDRINHALAFAAKHHDQQVRRGTRAPYLTQPANVAIILTRYGQDEPTVVAGILHDVVDDLARDGYSRDVLRQRLADKFGEGVLATLLSVTHRHVDDDGVELTPEERRDDLITRLAHATREARWVCVADKLHQSATLVADLRRTVEPATVWSRLSGGRDATVRWHRRLHDRLAALGFDAPIMREFEGVVKELEALPG
jgi:(p)ppGpp synthase/HD superfamily hydrolase